MSAHFYNGFNDGLFFGVFKHVTNETTVNFKHINRKFRKVILMIFKYLLTNFK